MPRYRSTAVLVITLAIGLLAATVLSAILSLFVTSSSVVYRVLISSYVYEAGPLVLNLIVATFTFGFDFNINLLTILGLMSAFYWWKYRL
jgi:hypothetical protein